MHIPKGAETILSVINVSWQRISDLKTGQSDGNKERSVRSLLELGLIEKRGGDVRLKPRFGEKLTAKVEAFCAQHNITIERFIFVAVAEYLGHEERENL